MKMQNYMGRLDNNIRLMDKSMYDSIKRTYNIREYLVYFMKAQTS